MSPRASDSAPDKVRGTRSPDPLVSDGPPVELQPLPPPAARGSSGSNGRNATEERPRIEELDTSRRQPGVCALIHTLNEEVNLPDCLDALDWCDEILVVDSFSNDRTEQIARSRDREDRRVRFVQHPYYGAAAQKNRAMRLVEHEWVLIFDADERCTPALRDEILATLATQPADDIFIIHRRTWYLGRVLRHSGFKNDRVARLIRAGKGQYENRRVHARVLGPSGQAAIRYAPALREPMDHLMVTSLARHLERVRRYAWWGAAQAWRDGRRIGPWGILRRSIWRFLRTYGLQAGFLDGMRGFVFCVSQSMGTFMKWSILWSWQCAERDGRAPDLPVFDDDPSIWAPGSKEATSGGRN